MLKICSCRVPSLSNTITGCTIFYLYLISYIATTFAACLVLIEDTFSKIFGILFEGRPTVLHGVHYFTTNMHVTGRSWQVVKLQPHAPRLVSEHLIKNENKHLIMNVHTKWNCLIPTLSSLIMYYLFQHSARLNYRLNWLFVLLNYVGVVWQKSRVFMIPVLVMSYPCF